MADIGVYTKIDVLDHKRNDGMKKDGKYCFWSFAKLPKVKVGDRIYFAVAGLWAGYFIINKVVKEPCEVLFHSETWSYPDGTRIETRSPFRGFTYRVPPRGG